MSMPTAPSCPMPAGAALPRSRAPWNTDPARAAPLVQGAAEPAGQPPGRRGLLGDLRGPGIGEEPQTAAIVPALVPRPGEHLPARVHPNAFLHSRLGRLPRSEGRDRLIVCRVRARVGVLLTTADALLHDIRPSAVGDAAAEEHALALRRAARIGVVCTTGGPLDALPPPGEPADA